MYYIYLPVDGVMMEWGKSESFADLVNVARGIGTEKEVKITGSEGTWHRPAGTNKFNFTQSSSATNA
jgi:hypothetical protein